jgi:hypothetical protein
MTDTTNHALKVNIVAGSAAGGTSSELRVSAAWHRHGGGIQRRHEHAGRSCGGRSTPARARSMDSVGNLVRRASGGPVELIGSSTSANSIPGRDCLRPGRRHGHGDQPVDESSRRSAAPTSSPAGFLGLIAVAGNVAHDARRHGEPVPDGRLRVRRGPGETSQPMGTPCARGSFGTARQVVQPTYQRHPGLRE